MEGTTFVRSGVTAEGDGTLLEVAEGAGLTPPNRCRRGVCATCTTALVSGTVRDGRTGAPIAGAIVSTDDGATAETDEDGRFSVPVEEGRGRRLTAEGGSFKEIKNRLRRDTALHFLGKQGLSIEEIAHRAGFSESSAFIRAFKSWTGVTPYSYRKGL